MCWLLKKLRTTFVLIHVPVHPFDLHSRTSIKKKRRNEDTSIYVHLHLASLSSSRKGYIEEIMLPL